MSSCDIYADIAVNDYKFFKQISVIRTPSEKGKIKQVTIN